MKEGKDMKTLKYICRKYKDGKMLGSGYFHTMNECYKFIQNDMCDSAVIWQPDKNILYEVTCNYGGEQK